MVLCDLVDRVSLLRWCVLLCNLEKKAACDICAEYGETWSPQRSALEVEYITSAEHHGSDVMVTWAGKINDDPEFTSEQFDQALKPSSSPITSRRRSSPTNSAESRASSLTICGHRSKRRTASLTTATLSRPSRKPSPKTATTHRTRQFIF